MINKFKIDRYGLADDEAWSQEYLCQFMDTSSVLLPYELIEACESNDASESFAIDQHPRTSRFFAGIDFGRKNNFVPAENETPDL